MEAHNIDTYLESLCRLIEGGRINANEALSNIANQMAMETGTEYADCKETLVFLYNGTLPQRYANN